MSDMIKQSLSTELWREYDFGGRVYRINNPGDLYYRPGGTTHCITTYDGQTDTVVVHCVPAPGEKGCVLRWQSADQKKPVDF